MAMLQVEQEGGAQAKIGSPCIWGVEGNQSETTKTK